MLIDEYVPKARKMLTISAIKHEMSKCSCLGKFVERDKEDVPEDVKVTLS